MSVHVSIPSSSCYAGTSRAPTKGLLTRLRVSTHIGTQQVPGASSRKLLQAATRRLTLHCVLSPDAPARDIQPEQASAVVLVGDIGGTNCRLNLWHVTGEQYEMLAEQTYPTNSYASFPEALGVFLKQLPPDYMPADAALAVAGPVKNNCCVMTNCPWTIDGSEVKQLFSIPTKVLNDFEAVGYGITALDKRHLVALNPDAAVTEKGPILCLGPGTGLGVAQVVWDSGLGRYKVLPSEGAHGTFGPRGELQRELQAWVEAKEGFCETELVACGKGILRIYNFLCDRAGKACTMTTPAEVTSAMKEGDPMAVEAVDIFLTILGAEAGNLALSLLATGGVYLCGGITPKLLDRMQAPLLKAFLYEENPKFNKLLRSFPLFAVKTEDLGLLGCREYATNMALK